MALTTHVIQQRSPSCFSSGVVESREFLFIFQSGDKNEDHSGPPTICPVRPRTSVFYELLQSAFVVRGMEGREGGRCIRFECSLGKWVLLEFGPTQNGKPDWCCLSWQKSADWECVSPGSKYSAVLSELMPYLGTGGFYHKRLIYQSFQSC